MNTRRSLRLSSKGKDLVQRALIQLQLSHSKLAQVADVSESTAKKFLKADFVDRSIFVHLCKTLDLDWSEVTEPSLVPGASDTKLQLCKNPSSITHARSTSLDTKEPTLILTGIFDVNLVQTVEHFGKHVEGLLLDAHIVIDQQRGFITVEGMFKQDTKDLIEAVLEQFARYLISSHITYFISKSDL
jgi:DNA-binding Xre family transcriptional regulator